MKQLLTGMMLCFSLIQGISQIQVSGLVTDNDGSPMIGVNILESGTTNGTTSDIDGNYSIRVANNATLIFSYIGYQNQEVAVNGRTTVDVVLNDDSELIDEIVIIGYGAIKKDQVTSSISSVKGKELTKISASNPAESLQGKASGVQVLSSGGSPGASPQILVRGITTNNGSNPLIVLDGVPLGTGSLNFLNPEDIESFQILKDASASAIYGSRASNGVILVKTKRGKVGKTAINLDVSYGGQNLERVQLADANEYIQVVNNRRTNDGLTPVYDAANINADTDWWSETVTNYAPILNLNLRASGGSEKTKYSGSVSYFNQESNFSKGWYEKITGRFNIDFKISDRVSLKQDLNPRIENWEGTPGVFYNLMRIDPLTNVYLPQDEREGRNIYSIYEGSNNLVPNPVGVIDRIFDETTYFGFLSNTQLNVKITNGLSLNTQLGLNIDNTRRDVFNPQYFTTPNQQREINNIRRNTSQNFDYVLNNTLTYNKTFDKHYVNLMGGVLFDSQRFNYLNGYRENTPGNENSNLWYLDAATGEGLNVNGNEAVENIFSTIARGIYSYDNRYFITASVRMDESSRFAAGNRRGIFPSVSVAWDVDSESFFNIPSITNLKLKAGFGQIGNQNINRNGQFFSIGTGNYVFNQERVVTNFLSQFGNPNLQWETIEDINVGFISSLFNGAVDLSFEYYRKTSKDLLFSVELPNYTGIPGTVAQNVGSFRSKGYDLGLGYNRRIGELDFDLQATISTNESKAIALAPGNEQLFGQKREDLGNRFIKITELDQTVGLFYGFQTLGIFQNQTEINAHSSEEGNLLQPNARPGDMIFADVNQDGVLDDDDMTNIGNPFPDFYGGIIANVAYKNFDLSMQLYGTKGNDVFNYTSTFLYAGNQDVNVASGTLEKVWTENNTGARFPRLTVNDRNGNYARPSDLFIEDGSYLRLRNIQFGYNFSTRGITNMRVYLSAQNLFTLTGYSGLDPEVSAGGNIINGYGVDYARYPVAKTFLIGLNLNI